MCLRDFVQRHRIRDVSVLEKILIFCMDSTGSLVELLRRDWNVSVGALGKREIDFVAQKHDDRLYVQVATYLTEESTLDREFGNLEAIHDNYPKIVLSMDDLPVGGRNGVRWQNVREWLQTAGERSTTGTTQWRDRN